MNQLLKRLDDHFIRLRDKIALRDDITQPGITYGQLDELSGRIYGYLKERGVGREDTVMLCLPRGLQIPIAMVGVWKAGAGFVVCEDTYAPERIEFIKNDCDCKLFVSRDNWAELMAHDYLHGRETVQPHDLAYSCYTSGTTGNPKGVMHEFGNLDESCFFKQWNGARLVEEADTLALNAPLNFVAAQDYFNNVLFSGATLFVVAYSYVKNPVALIELYEQAGITCTFMTPSSFRVTRSINPQMRWIALGGEPCANLYRDGVMVFNAYNMSEAGCDLCLFQLDRAYDATPIGQNRGGRVLRLLDENGADVPDGTPGELCYENPYVRGYRNLPEKTAEAWRDGLFHSGDIVVKNENGDLVLQGRNDDMIKINGNRIEPAEIEAACKKVLPFSWVCAKGFVTEKQAFVALYYTDELDVDPAFMREALAKLLPYYMIPAYYVRIDEIPLLPNGKLNKKALAAPDLNAYRTEYAAPENETEGKLCDAFARVLELDRVGANDDFYELGGDSLRSMEVVTELEALGVEVSHIYKHRTARRIAAALLAEADDAGKSDEHRNGNALEHEQPLNPFQVFMFDYQLYAPYTSMYNLPHCWKYAKKDIDSARLAAATEKVLRAHPIFRTRLRYNEDFRLVQYFDESMSTEVRVEHVTEGKMKLILPQLVQPFRLMLEPMYRVRIFETAENVYMFFDVHHIIFDGTSLGVLLKDLTTAYNGGELGVDLYYLFMRDEYKFSQTAEYAEAEARFRKLYGGKNWVVAREPEMENRENGFDFILEDLDVREDALAAYLHEAGIGRTAFFEAVALLALASLEQAEDVMLTWVYHARDSRKYDSAMGLLCKELPLALSIGELTDVRSMYQSVREQMNLGIANRNIPYATLSTNLAVNDSLEFVDESDLVTVDLTAVRGIEGIPFEMVALPQASPSSLKFMVIMIINDGKGGVSMRLTYAGARYHRSSMEAFCRTYKRIAAGLAAGKLTDSVRDILNG